MKHELPKLPYAMNALEPHMSQETLEHHYVKHHQAYVTKLNELIQGTEYENMDLVEIIRKSSGGLFNQAAQVWNHTFFWNCLSPNGGGEPTGELADAINKTWGSFENFKKELSEKAVNNFASGWGWLVKKKDGSLAIEQTDDAETPIQGTDSTPLMTCDIWEHAYYIDYRNVRPKFLEAFFNLVNWDFVAENFKK